MAGSITTAVPKFPPPREHWIVRSNNPNATPTNRNHAMYQANLPDLIAKSMLPHTMQDYNAALSNAASFLKEIEKAHANPLPGHPLAKSTFSESTSAISGLTYYDLETGAKFVYPFLTPLRNQTPRVSGKGGVQANWRAVTGVNTTGLRIGVSGGNRGGVQAVSTQDYTAAYKGIGIETSVDFEAQYAGMGFDDVKAIGAKTGLEACMLGEELLILGGNTSVPLGTTPTPSLAPSTSGGALTATASPYSVICVALSLDGIVNGSVLTGIQGAITRTNADSSSDTFGGGASAKSANATASIASGTTGSIAATVAPVTGALGYAWFWGAVGSELLGAITTINSLVITANATGTQTAASLGASDNSTNALVFDGLLYQAFKSGSNAYVNYLATGTAGTGSTLTGDGAGGIVEIDAALQDRWNNYRLSPDTMWVSSQEANDVSKKILAGNANAAQRFVFDADQGALGGGVMVRTYLNKFSMAGPKTLDIRIHPNLPAGTILMTAKTLPYPLSNVGNVMQVRTRQDYYQIEWPPRARRYESGVYADEVLQHYFPPSMAIISNIAVG
jgi:hypothetical protein